MPTKSTGKKSVKKTTGRKPTAKQREAQERANKQMWAVVLFAAGLLLGFLAFVPGSSYWFTLHTGLFGLLGFGAYLLGPLLIYVAVTASLDKPAGPVSHKLWQGFTLLLLLCALLQILGMGLPKSIGFAYSVTEIFQAGTQLRGGGLMGAIIGLPLLHLFERTGALITVSLLIFVFLMLVTGSTLMELFSSAAKPVKKLEQVYNEKVEERRNNPPEERRRRFNIDIPVDDPPVKPEEPPTPRPPEPMAIPTAATPTPVVPSAAAPPITAPESSPPEESPEEEAQSAYLEEIIRRAAMGRKPQSPLTPEVLPDQLAFEEPTDPDSPVPGDLTDVPFAVDSAEDAPNLDEPSPVDAPFEEPEPEPEPQECLPVPVPEKVYVYPSITLLNEPIPDLLEENTPEELRANAQRLVDTLQSFGVQTRIIDICRGPAVTRYELQPSAGVKISKITGLADDIALNLAASGVRIEAPIPNKAAVGIEIPNRTVSAVTLREILDSTEFVSAKSKLSVAMGRDIAGNVMIADIAKMPHVLIAGATGSGKSVCINSIIMSLLYKASDKEVKFLMIDPKVVELGIYNGIPHLLVPVVTDPKKAAGALNWAVAEMLKRYQIFAENSVRDLAAYNALAQARQSLPDARQSSSAGSDTLLPLPQIVIIIDELSDLMMATPGDVEDAICRLAQMARAAGMHLVIATQRPSVDVITGVIKANIPSRVAFAVSSQVDSRTILDGSGAEKLLGRGDMLFSPVGMPKPVRVQGCFVTDKEVERVVEFIKEGEKHQYDTDIMEEIERQVPREKGQHASSDDGGGFEESDDMLPAAIEAVIETGQASTSFLQRRLKVGYARAGRLIDEMDQMGIVGPFEGSKPRQVLISKERWYEMKLSSQETIQ